MTGRCNTWVEVNHEVLRRNLMSIRTAAGSRTEVIQVVKANAYGHGLAVTATTGYDCGVKWFLVVRMDEALLLRKVMPDAGVRILLLGAVWVSDLSTLIISGITPVLTDINQARALAQAARNSGIMLSCHFEVDTGMGRSGLVWETAAMQILDCQRRGGLDIQGICMHFASADDVGADLTAIQISRFKRVAEKCREGGLDKLFKHASNSAAFIHHPEMDLDGVRPGILSYGYGSQPPGVRAITVPALQWKTRVMQVRQVPAGFTVSYNSTYVTSSATRLATIDAGYSDGLSRLMSNRGYVLAGGQRAKIVGRVTMNFTVVDIGISGDVNAGDEVVLIGTQGKGSIWADEMSQWCQTIPYECLTNIRSEHFVITGRVEGAI